MHVSSARGVCALESSSVFMPSFVHENLRLDNNSLVY